MNYIKLAKAIGILVLWTIIWGLAFVVLVKWPWTGMVIALAAGLLCLASVMVAVIYNELD